MGKSKHVPRDTKKLERKAFKADKHDLKEERKDLVIHNETKLGVHNCPAKDAGTTHPFRARCLKQQHAGYCPACGGIFSRQHGCKQHEVKGEGLLERCPTEEDKGKYRTAHGVKIPSQAGGDSPASKTTKAKKQSPLKNGK